MDGVPSVIKHIEWLKGQCWALMQGRDPEYLVICHSMYAELAKAHAVFPATHDGLPIWVIPDSVWTDKFVSLAFSLEQLAFQCTGKVKFR